MTSKKQRRARRKRFIKYLRAAFEDRCVYCGSNVEPTMEHLVPQSCGGTWAASNLVVACRACNEARGASPIVDFASGRGVDLLLLVFRIRAAQKRLAELLDRPGTPLEIRLVLEGWDPITHAKLSAA